MLRIYLGFCPFLTLIFKMTVSWSLIIATTSTEFFFLHLLSILVKKKSGKMIYDLSFDTVVITHL